MQYPAAVHNSEYRIEGCLKFGWAKRAGLMLLLFHWPGLTHFWRLKKLSIHWLYGHVVLGFAQSESRGFYESRVAICQKYYVIKSWNSSRLADNWRNQIYLIQEIQRPHEEISGRAAMGKQQASIEGFWEECGTDKRRIVQKKAKGKKSLQILSHFGKTQPSDCKNTIRQTKTVWKANDMTS